jgi:protein O-GlcNAc transferase
MAKLVIQQALASGLKHHEAGRLHEAETHYRQILAQDPNHAEALHLLGVLADQVGRHDVAVELIRRSIALDPRIPEPHSNLGNVLQSLGQLDEAIKSYQRALILNPDYADAHNNLGNAFAARGETDKAIACYQRSLLLRPDSADAHHNLGIASQTKGQIDNAIASYQRAVVLRPDFADAFISLGNASQAKGELDKAIAFFQRAMALRPDYPEPYVILGVALQEKGEWDQAMACHRRAIAIKPDLVEAQINLGNVLREKGELREAIACYERAATLKPDVAMIYNNAGVALQAAGRIDEAIASYQRALVLQPDLAQAHNNIGISYQAQGRIDEAIACFKRAVELKPDYTQADSNQLFALHLSPRYDSHAILQEHLRWNQYHALPQKKHIRPHTNDRTPDRQLRIGYVSADFREHVVGWNLLPLLKEHDPKSVEIFCYSDVRQPDAITEQIQLHAKGWRKIMGVSDDRVSETIRHDQIDILVDLAQHTIHNRLLVFARKPAPVQLTYLGYSSTTGMETMDYRLSDPDMDPPDIDLSCYREKTIRLPETYWCYQPGGPTPDVSPLPAMTTGYITFGCLNNFAKVSTEALDLWAVILRQVPRSRLLLHTKSGSQRQAATERFAHHGISADRLEFVGQHPWAEYIRQYNRIDIALDPFPYGGGITTCDSMYMGVPVVTLSGRTAVGRGGRSILSNVGLPELVAYDPPQYVSIAAELAADLPKLSQIRSTLRQRMQQSPLMDAPRFARNIESAYRQMWRAWCETL